MRVTEAFRADALAQMSAMASSVAESLKEPGTSCHRSASMLSCGGRVPFRYPYAPKRGVSHKALAKFGCEDGKSRTTPEARRVIAESGAQLDSLHDRRRPQEALPRQQRQEIGEEAFPVLKRPTYRKILCHNRHYWIFYRILKGKIEIMSVKHTLQRVDALHDL